MARKQTDSLNQIRFATHSSPWDVWQHNCGPSRYAHVVARVGNRTAKCKWCKEVFTVASAPAKGVDWSVTPDEGEGLRLRSPFTIKPPSEVTLAVVSGQRGIPLETIRKVFLHGAKDQYGAWVCAQIQKHNSLELATSWQAYHCSGSHRGRYREYSPIEGTFTQWGYQPQGQYGKASSFWGLEHYIPHSHMNVSEGIFDALNLTWGHTVATVGPIRDNSILRLLDYQPISMSIWADSDIDAGAMRQRVLSECMAMASRMRVFQWGMTACGYWSEQFWEKFPYIGAISSLPSRSVFCQSAFVAPNDSGDVSRYTNKTVDELLDGDTVVLWDREFIPIAIPYVPVAYVRGEPGEAQRGDPHYMPIYGCVFLSTKQIGRINRDPDMREFLKTQGLSSVEELRLTRELVEHLT